MAVAIVVELDFIPRLSIVLHVEERQIPVLLVAVASMLECTHRIFVYEASLCYLAKQEHCMLIPKAV